MNEPTPRILNHITRAIRLYKEDDLALMELKRKIESVSGMNQSDLIRDCIQAGRPIIERRWKPIIAEIEREKKEREREK
jgi:hypothetical protein